MTADAPVSHDKADRPPVSPPLLEVDRLRVAYPRRGGVFRRKRGEVKAVDDVSFSLQSGETLGLVGESGCGKTTVGKAVINLLRATSPDISIEGRIIYHAPGAPVNLLALSQAQMRAYRSQVQMIFQDPYSSLNPRMTVRQTIERALQLHGSPHARSRTAEVARLLDRVGLQASDADRYPHEFSGGQRQRIGIARSLATRPRLIVADEPVSALDVSVQAQVINLLQDLQDEFQLTYLFVAHDLSVVYHISRRIAVMYLGKLVEIGDAETVYRQPAHPYTRALLAAAPKPNPGGKIQQRSTLRGEIPTPLNRPSGCAFRTRCPMARPECATFVPPLEVKASGQLAACPYV